MSGSKETKSDKQCGKRKADKDNNTAPLKQHKGEAKKANRRGISVFDLCMQDEDCPECLAGRPNCPPDGADTKAFCASCRYYWRNLTCAICGVCFVHTPDEGSTCRACLKEAKEASKSKCAKCQNLLKEGGICWWEHNRCKGGCGKPNELCQCILLLPGELKMLKEFGSNPAFHNYAQGEHYKCGPDWEWLVEHAKNVLAMAEHGLANQQKLRDMRVANKP